MSLLRGFLIGAADTGTALRQQAIAGDDKQVENRIKAYGPAYDAYTKGVSEFAKENEKIKTVASMLEAQDPDFVENLSAADLEDVAQSLILRSGKDKPGEVLDYFMTNKNKLSVVQGAKPEAPTTAADMQTSQMLTKTSTQPDNRSFFQRAFGGSTEEQLKNRTAKELGISRAQYDTVTSGKIPTMDAPETMLRLRQDSKFSKIIKDRQSKVLDAVTKDAFLKGTFKLPDGKEVTGKQFAASLMEAATNFELNGGDGATLMKMQQFALTQAMPEKARDMFQFHKPRIDKISEALASNKIQDASVKNQLEQINNNIFEMAAQAEHPGFASSSNASKLNDEIVKGMKLISSISDDKETSSVTNSAAYKQLDKSITNIMTKLNSDTGGKPKDEETAAEMRGLRRKLVDAVNSTNPLDSMNKLFPDVERLMNSFVAPIDDGGDKKLPYFMDIVKRMPRYSHLNNDALEKVAGALMVANPNGLFKADENGTFFMAPLTGNESGAPQKTYIDTLLPGGMTTKGGSKQIKDDDEKIYSNIEDFNSGAKLYTSVQKNPLVFTAFGAMTVAGQTYADVIGHFTEANIGQAYNQYFNAAEQAETRRKAIAMVGSAKDRLFDDPRLSDQDLRLVLKFIAVLGEDGRGMSTGSTEALAALQGLQVALLKDNAARMYRSRGYAASPNKIFPSNHSGTSLLPGSFYGEDGKFKADGSMASILYQHVATGYGIEIKTKDEIQAMSQSEKLTYGKSTAFITDMVKAALHDVKTHYIYGKTPDRASLVDMGEVTDQPDGTQVLNVRNASGTGMTSYKIQSLEAVKAQARAKRRGA